MNRLNLKLVLTAIVLNASSLFGGCVFLNLTITYIYFFVLGNVLIHKYKLYILI